ncbi:MAG TPA: glycoside hydrolase family 2 TIM barrel-domain containing protein, partial [Flavisolibacter sp.]
LKILGVCNHHDLGALGAAVNRRAIERQLEILKAMGCNAIRTAHNPPSPELLDLCDRLGFLVMDEAFDMWQKRKNKFDYHLEFADWHRQDLVAMVKRDRNHPSVFMWSIGNEIREQFDSTGLSLTKEMVQLVKQHDTTRPVTSALTENIPDKNFIYRSGALDVLGFNYKHADYPSLPGRFPGYSFLATETASALATRGHYEFPSDSVRIWPRDAKSKDHGNPEHTASAYDNTYAYWGATHEESWMAVKKHPFMAGIFVWAGFDFLGEPVPYGWPSRSSYYGIIDLAGFPKDVYYLYQSEWSTKPVLHIFPHWNWKEGQVVDVWAYYNNADEVELFLNGVSQGVRKKRGDSLHVMWSVKFTPGTLKVISRKAGKPVLQKEIRTAGAPARIQLIADRKKLSAATNDLSFITIKLLDAAGNSVPDADKKISFAVRGPAFLAGVDNGDPVSMESFQSPERKLFNGLCLAIVQTTGKKGIITLVATAEGLPPATIQLQAD